MTKLLSLIKTDLNVTFGLSSFAYTLKTGKRKWTYALVAIAMLSLIPSYVMLVKGLSAMYTAFKQIGQQSYFLMMGVMAAQMMVFFLGLLYVMGKYYFSKDIEQLLPLPIKPSQIVGSKFVTLTISEYLFTIPIAAPFFIIYGTSEYAGALYWAVSILIIVLLPLIPLALATIVVMVFMKYTNLKNKRDLVRIISAIVFVSVVIFIQMKVNQLVTRGLFESESFMFNLARDAQMLVRGLGKAYPPAMWSAFALTGAGKLSGFINAVGFTFASMISAVAAIFLSEKLFLDGLIGGSDTAASKDGVKRDENTAIRLKRRSPYLALAHKELMMLIKTPIYVLNSVGGVVIVPIILVMSLVTSGSDLEFLKSYLDNSDIMVALIGSGAIAMMGMLNSIGITTFSREGKNLWIQRTLPISPKNQIVGRLLASLTVQGIGTVFLLGSLAFIVKLSFADIAIIVLVGGLGSITMTILGMTIDIIRPMRDWTNPQQAMKQNLNVLIGMAVAAIYLGALGYVSFLLRDSVNSIILVIGISLVFLITAILDYKLLEELIEKQFIEIEE